MRIKNWDYRELRERIADGVTLRQFTDLNCGKAPSMMPSTAASIG
jgi:transposase, IS5 family